MPTLTIPAIAGYWVGAGGPADQTVTAVAVAMAESSGNTEAHSGTGDWGLWQINEVHAAFFGADWPNRLDPATNARMAVSVSSGGTNWAPWAVCYVNIGASGWSSYLSGPQAGSAAAGRVPQVVAALAQAGPGAPGGSATVCHPGDIGIPLAIALALAPGESVQTVTCDGGPFDAGDLAPGYVVSWTDGNGAHAVSSFDAGTFVPPGISVRLTRLTSVPAPGGGGPGVTPPVTPPPPGQTPYVPPVAPPPIGPVPSGAAREQLQLGWSAVSEWSNLHAPAILARVSNARDAIRSVTQ